MEVLMHTKVMGLRALCFGVLSLSALAVGLALSPLVGHSAENGSSPELKRFSKHELHMAVDFEVVVYAADELLAEKAIIAAFEKIAKLDDILSDYDSESELSRLSATAGGKDAVALSDDLFRVLAASQRVSVSSGGAFDVTVGPLTKLWRRARRQKELPTAERVAEARNAVGYQKLCLDLDRRTAILSSPGMRLDLGGIAKGFAVDEALKAIHKLGITRALVRGSGDIAAGDPPPGEKGWKVGLAPLDADAQPVHFISLANAAVSTSGDSRQHLIVDGRRYSHLIDPRIGTPVEGRSSVSVIAPTGMLADALASAVSVLGPEAGMALVEATDGAAALIVWQKDDSAEEPVTQKSKRFDSYAIDELHD
jgi:thiamine biosynthesis lipoprotein